MAYLHLLENEIASVDTLENGTLWPFVDESFQFEDVCVRQYIDSERGAVPFNKAP